MSHPVEAPEPVRPSNPGAGFDVGSLAGRVSLALIALAVVAVAIWQSGEERRAVRAMPEPERSTVFEKEWAALVEGCTEPPSALRDHCIAEARFVELFPECGADCRERTRRLTASLGTR